MINIFLDDERATPSGWVRAYTASETIHLLEKEINNIDMISLDHDLGEIGETGYDVLKWIESKVFSDPNYEPPFVLLVHSSNPVAVLKMKQCIVSIKNRLVYNENNLP